MRGVLSSKSNPSSPKSVQSTKSVGKPGQDLDNASTAVGNTLTQRTSLSSAETLGDAEAASSFSGSGFGEEGSGITRQISIRHPNPPDDGHFLDADFEEVCRATVAAERQRLVQATMQRAQQNRNDDVIGGESVFTSSPERLANFFKTDGASYGQYDLSNPQGSGGPLPEPWTTVRSRTTGKYYYANTLTGETRWEPPLYPLSREWSMQHSPQSGAVFYVHGETGRWQWERPVDEQFMDLVESGLTDAEALRIWMDRNAKADCGFAGLEDHPAAQKFLAALPAPPLADDKDAEAPAAAAALPALPDAPEALQALPAAA